MDEIYQHAFRVCAIWDTQAFWLMNYYGFNIEHFCSDVCGDHRRPQTLAEICRNMSICCSFGAVAAREKYPGFISLLLFGTQADLIPLCFLTFKPRADFKLRQDFFLFYCTYYWFQHFLWPYNIIQYFVRYYITAMVDSLRLSDAYMCQ